MRISCGLSDHGDLWLRFEIAVALKSRRYLAIKISRIVYDRGA